MATCPLARILTRSDAECEREKCQWWVNFEGGNCSVVVTLMALHSYFYMKMAGPPPEFGSMPDFEPPSSPKDFSERFKIDPENYKL